MMVVKSAIPIDPESREEAIEMMSDLSSKSREEDGMVDYHVSIDIDDENLLRLVEQFESEEAFNSHMQEEHTQEFVEELPEIVAGEVEAIRFDVESASELEM